MRGQHLERGFEQVVGAFAPARRVLRGRPHRCEGGIVGRLRQDLMHLSEAPADLGGERDAIGELRRL